MVLSSTGCKVPWALRGGCGLCGDLRRLGCGCCDSLRRGCEAFSLHIPDAGSLDLQLPCAGRPRRGLPATSLGSAASVVRAMGLCEKMRFWRGSCFSKMKNRGLQFHVTSVILRIEFIKKRLFRACCSRRFGNGRFFAARRFPL